MRELFIKSLKELNYERTYYIDSPKHSIFQCDEFDYYAENYNDFGSSLTLKDGDLICKVYSPYLAIILTSPSISIFDKRKKLTEQIDGTQYKEAFKTGYKMGTDYFQSLYGGVTKDLYGPHSEQLVKSISRNYLVNGRDEFSGWVYAKKVFPCAISQNNFTEIGFYSGLVYETEKLWTLHRELFNKFRFISADNSNSNKPKNQQESHSSKADSLGEKIGKYGFFTLPKIKKLNQSALLSLLEIITNNGLPYSIAMLDHVGFIDHLYSNYSESKEHRNKLLATFINSGKNVRGIGGHIRVLDSKSNENREKYTSHIHTETVKKDYLNIIQGYP